MDQPLVIIFTATVVGFIALVGSGILIGKLDSWLMHRNAPLALLRRPPVVNQPAGNTIEVVQFGKARLDAIPGLMMWGYLVTGLIVMLPLLTQSQNPKVVGTSVFSMLALLVLLLLITLSIRSRFTYYHIALTTGKIQKQVKIFGLSGKTKDILVTVPVEASADCQPKKVELRDSRLRHATCWTSTRRRKIIVVHKNAQEAEQFNAKLIQYGCPVSGQPKVINNQI